MFIWNKAAQKRREEALAKAQDYVDRECLKYALEYTPVAKPKYKNAGKLRDSGHIKEPGKIVYDARFARKDYYANKNHQNGGNPKATRMWFEKVKTLHGREILKGATAIIKKGK